MFFFGGASLAYLVVLAICRDEMFGVQRARPAYPITALIAQTQMASNEPTPVHKPRATSTSPRPSINRGHQPTPPLNDPNPSRTRSTVIVSRSGRSSHLVVQARIGGLDLLKHLQTDRPKSSTKPAAGDRHSSASIIILTIMFLSQRLWPTESSTCQLNVSNESVSQDSEAHLLVELKRDTGIVREAVAVLDRPCVSYRTCALRTSPRAFACVRAYVRGRVRLDAHIVHRRIGTCRAILTDPNR